MRRFALIAAFSIPLALLLLVGGWYVADEVLADHEMSRNTSVGAHSVSRMSQTEALAQIEAHEADLLASPITAVVDGVPVTLEPSAVGLAVDVETTLEAAVSSRRSEAWYENVGLWLTTWWEPATVEAPIEVDEKALAALFDDWTAQWVDDPAFEGSVFVENDAVVAEYPRAGRMVDADAATELLLAELAEPTGAEVVIPLTGLEPVVTDDQIDAAAAEAARIIDGEVLLTSAYGDGTLVFPPGLLGRALSSEVVIQSPAEVVLRLDPEVLAEVVGAAEGQLDVAPVDATFRFDPQLQTLQVLGSTEGRVVDLERLPESVLAAALADESRPIPMATGQRPSFTTQDALAMGPLGKVSEFTTYHPCCESRVTNIQTIAAAVDGTLVFPGEVFSINEIVGERTTAKGYVAAGAIIGGRVECCDSPINIGGGTSQFATTLWNAVFFGCYEDVEHTPHSIYFSRYPFIREATLGFPYPDVKWRNDSDAVVLVDTSWTRGSITVTLYGNNGGRTCESETRGNTNTRIMTWPDGSVTTESWTWNYRPELPPTTTTTIPPSTSSTEASSTTTEGSTSPSTP